MNDSYYLNYFWYFKFDQNYSNLSFIMQIKQKYLNQTGYFIFFILCLLTRNYFDTFIQINWQIFLRFVTLFVIARFVVYSKKFLAFFIHYLALIKIFYYYLENYERNLFPNYYYLYHLYNLYCFSKNQLIILISFLDFLTFTIY